MDLRFQVSFSSNSLPYPYFLQQESGHPTPEHERAKWWGIDGWMGGWMGDKWGNAARIEGKRNNSALIYGLRRVLRWDLVDWLNYQD